MSTNWYVTCRDDRLYLMERTHDLGGTNYDTICRLTPGEAHAMVKVGMCSPWSKEADDLIQADSTAPRDIIHAYGRGFRLILPAHLEFKRPPFDAFDPFRDWDAGKFAAIVERFSIPIDDQILG